MLATQATRVRKDSKVWLVHLVHLAQRVLPGYKKKMDQRGNKEQSVLQNGDMGEREVSRVIWALQVHQEKLVREETWAKKVKQVQKV